MSRPDVAPDESAREGVDLAVSVAGLTLSDPVMVASGCAGSGRDLAPYLDLAGLGAFVTGSVTLDVRAGGPPPRLAEAPSGVLTGLDLQGPGVDGFLATELPWLAQQRVRTVVSLAASTLGEHAELARRVGQSPGVAAVEVNLGWPRTSQAGRSGYQAAKILSVVRRELPAGVELLAKLDCDVHAVADVARSSLEAGAGAVVVGGAVPGLVIDQATLRPALGTGRGALSGPAVHATSLACVWEVCQALPDAPVVAVGGVRTGYDALAMLLAGARAVQVGTAVLHDPAAPRRIAAELAHELAARGVTRVTDIVGRAHRPEGEPL